jgi:hypothetical protein
MKRALAVLLFIALGFFALRMTIGDEDAVRANGNEVGAPPTKKQQPPANPPGVRVAGGGIGASVSQHGPLTISKPREVDIGNGRTRKEDVFVLRAKDSRPIGDGLQQLIGVTMELFDKGKHAATIVASDAFVELGRDPNGVAAFDEQKKVDVRGCIITGEPGSQLAGVRMDLGDATIVITDDDVQLKTLPDQVVTITLEGSQPMQLTGRGAEALLPRSSESTLREAKVTILANPLLTTDNAIIRATGQMRYVEDTLTGEAKISLDDDVVLEVNNGSLRLPGLAANSPGSDATKSIVRGDQFIGWLLRSKDKANAPSDSQDKTRGSVGWQRMALRGSPATVDMPGIHVATPALTIRPGPLGDAFVITAHGGESRVEQTQLQPGSKQTAPIVTTSPSRIHMVRPSSAAGALHRGMGFPQWTLRSLEQQQVIIYEGAAHFESGTRTIGASKGLMVYARQNGTTGIVQGFGDISFLDRGTAKKPNGKMSPELRATSNDGMLLTIGEDHEQLQLGPAMDERSRRWREHRYHVSYGDAAVRGLGACQIKSIGDRTQLEMRAPFDEIEADFDTEGTRLRNVRQLLATLDGQEVTELDVGGLPVRATFRQRNEALLAQAPRLRQIGPRSIRLLPMELDESPWSEMNELDRTPRLLRTWNDAQNDAPPREHSVEVVGPRIDVHYAGGHQAIIDAHALGDDLPRIYAKVPQPGDSQPTTVTCAAQRLQVLPFLLTPEARRMHFAGHTGLLADITTHALSQPWLLVDKVRDFQLDDQKQGHITGSGKHLLLSQGGKALLFIGDADEQTPAAVTRSIAGRTTTVAGARVRLISDTAVRLSALGAFEDHSTFLSPTMTLHDPASSGLLSNMQAVCRGNIQVDPDAIRFDGPVEAHGLTTAGNPDPDGINIDAKQLIMQRLVAGARPSLAIGKPGDISVIKGKDVVIDWTRLNVEAAEIELDVPNGHCIASDPNGTKVQLPDGRTLRSVWTYVNYRTWSFRTGASSVSQLLPNLANPLPESPRKDGPR